MVLPRLGLGYTTYFNPEVATEHLVLVINILGVECWVSIQVDVVNVVLPILGAETTKARDLKVNGPDVREVLSNFGEIA